MGEPNGHIVPARRSTPPAPSSLTPTINANHVMVRFIIDEADKNLVEIECHKDYLKRPLADVIALLTSKSNMPPELELLVGKKGRVLNPNRTLLEQDHGPNKSGVVDLQCMLIDRQQFLSLLENQKRAASTNASIARNEKNVLTIESGAQNTNESNKLHVDQMMDAITDYVGKQWDDLANQLKSLNQSLRCIPRASVDLLYITSGDVWIVPPTTSSSDNDVLASIDSICTLLMLSKYLYDKTESEPHNIALVKHVKKFSISINEKQTVTRKLKFLVEKDDDNDNNDGNNETSSNTEKLSKLSVETIELNVRCIRLLMPKHFLTGTNTLLSASKDKLSSLTTSQPWSYDLQEYLAICDIELADGRFLPLLERPIPLHCRETFYISPANSVTVPTQTRVHEIYKSMFESCQVSEKDFEKYCHDDNDNNGDRGSNKKVTEQPPKKVKTASPQKNQ